MVNHRTLSGGFTITARFPRYNLSVSPTARQPPGRGALGRPGQPYCSLGPDGAQSSGPCSHWQRHCIAAVNLNSGARPFPIAKNFARSARPLPTRQWSSSLCRYSRHLPPAGGSLSYQGSWHREAMTERFIPQKTANDIRGTALCRKISVKGRSFLLFFRFDSKMKCKTICGGRNAPGRAVFLQLC